MIPEEESFTLTAYVESPGYVTVIPRGFLVSRRDEEVWVAPLIPQLFYGATGEQLKTWRQYIPKAGEQVILSRRAGYPKVPREQLYWRRLEAPLEELVPAQPSPSPWLLIPALTPILFSLATILYSEIGKIF